MTFWNDTSNLFPKQSHRWIISLGEKDPNIYSNKLPMFIAKSIDRPSYDIGSKQLKFLYSHQFNFPQRVTWKPIKIEFYDCILSKIKYGESKTLSGDDKNKAKPPDFKYTQKYKKVYSYEGNYLKFNNTRYRMTTQGYFSSNILYNAGYVNYTGGATNDEWMSEYSYKHNLIQTLLSNQTDKPSSNYITINELNEHGYIIEQWRLYNPLITSANFGKLDYTTDNINTVNVDIVYDWAEMISVENTGYYLNPDGTTSTSSTSTETPDIPHKDEALNEMKSYEKYLKSMLQEIKQKKEYFKSEIDIYKEAIKLDKVEVGTKRYIDIYSSIEEQTQKKQKLEQTEVYISSVIEKVNNLINSIDQKKAEQRQALEEIYQNIAY